MGCRFCATARHASALNLSIQQIVNHALATANYGHDDLGLEPLRSVTFAGMGEPLANYDNVISSIRTLSDLGIPLISVSTIGLLKPMYKLINESINIRLYLSLHSAFSDMRRNLIPGSSGNLTELIDVMSKFSENRPNGSAQVSYLLLRGINDTPRDLSALINLLRGRNLWVQLLMYNQVEETAFERVQDSTAEQWIKVLSEEGIMSYIMPSRGRSIAAACGQLATLQYTTLSDQLNR